MLALVELCFELIIFSCNFPEIFVQFDNLSPEKVPFLL